MGIREFIEQNNLIANQSVISLVADNVEATVYFRNFDSESGLFYFSYEPDTDNVAIGTKTITSIRIDGGASWSK
ncbi:hypothetical protein SAMN05192574_105330 [Mucilaginibacter gossypiicola]|uniref:Uncharacterized protein n=1 Tax=Mucilaginibacter gossypiicola TaxID=551995 RepID=A0A1H8M0V3_9SPHI|nr:hypothetical protein [Mucilaginibacter gossypiicola]SEO10768.1 hypothetical protein SAMN05192574_105330 [Mucilaginibacter gossypiicola]